MQKSILDYYKTMPKSIALGLYYGIYNFIKKKAFSEKIVITNYKQKLITDYYSIITKDKTQISSIKLRQPLITEFYHKN
jgi:hypothetical protein